MILIFNPDKIPRTITREEWKEMWRWKRKVEKQLLDEVAEDMKNLMLYGSTMPEHIRQAQMEKLINPPCLLGPFQ